MTDAYRKSGRTAKGVRLHFIHPFDDEDCHRGAGDHRHGDLVPAQRRGRGRRAHRRRRGSLRASRLRSSTLRPMCRYTASRQQAHPAWLSPCGTARSNVLTPSRRSQDGIAVKQPGEHTFQYCKEYVDGVVTVTEDEICTAILALIEKEKLVAEGAGATPVAAVMAGKLPSWTARRCAALSRAAISTSPFEPRHHARSCDERQTVHAEHRAVRQARAARRRISNYRKMRRERRRRPS